MNKPSRQPDVLAVIERFGPITVLGIAEHLKIARSGISYHITQMGDKVHISGWECQRTASNQIRRSALWSAGEGRNVPMPKGVPTQFPDRVAVDIEKMPFRSVFAGGVSPWAGVAA